MSGDPDGVGLITSLGQIEALSNPVRSRILRQAGRPATVAELAERLDVPQTRLYYHVNLLVREGMLAQVDERKSGARIEKIYLRTAATFKLGAGGIKRGWRGFVLVHRCLHSHRQSRGGRMSSEAAR